MRKGRLIAIVGPMFSGKSEETYRRIRRHYHARKKVAIFKPAIDTRDDKNISITTRIIAVSDCIEVSRFIFV